MLPEGPELREQGSGYDYAAGAKKLLEKYPNIKLLNVTCGADGSYSFCCGRQVFVPSFRLGGTIETTGAGDTFCACVLNYVLEHGCRSRSTLWAAT